MTGNDQLEAELLRFVSARVPAGEEVSAETDLLEAELLDSLLVMDVVAHVESTYGVRLGEGDIAPRHFRTVGSIAELGGRKRS